MSCIKIQFLLQPKGSGFPCYYFMKKMTFDDYDRLCERVKENPYQCMDWWPSPEELNERIGKDICSNIDFLVWIMETNLPPETEEERISKRYINKLLIDNLKLYDPEDKQ